MTAFAVGEFVLSRVTAQGLTAGERYEVTGVDSQYTPFGEFVTYSLRHESGGKELSVGNGHLLLEESATLLIGRYKLEQVSTGWKDGCRSATYRILRDGERVAGLATSVGKAWTVLNTATAAVRKSPQLAKALQILGLPVF